MIKGLRPACFYFLKRICYSIPGNLFHRSFIAAKPIFALIVLIGALSFTACDDAANSYEDHYKTGVQLGFQGKFLKAQKEFRKSLEIFPQYSPAEGCLRIIDDVVAHNIQSRTARLLFMAIDYGNLGEPRKKIAEINSAIELDPGYAFAYNERGIAYFNLGMYERAISDPSRAIALRPNYPDPYYNKALACERAGRFSEAVEAYRGFLKYAPAHLKDHIRFAQMRIEELSGRLSKS